MAEDIGALAISLSIDSANFEQSMKSIDRNLKAMGQEMRGVQARGAEWGSSTAGLTAKQEGLSRMLDGQGTKVERLRAAYEASKAATGENSAATENLAIQLNRATAEYNRTETELAQVTAALRRQADELRLSQSNWTRLGETMQAVGEKLKAVGDKMTSVGKGLSVGLTAPIVAFGAAGIAAFNDVDEAIDTVITKTGATGDAADKLTENFRTVAKRVPDDLLSVGEAIGEVNTQFGFLGTELEDASQLMLQFASINGTDVTTASIASKQAIEAYGLANSDLNSVLDSVTKTAQDTGQSVDFLFDKATKGAPQIKALGLNFAEGTALIGSFEKAGVDSSAALSSMSKAQVIFAKGGKTLEEGLNGTIKSILGAKTETDALNIAAKVFGTKGGPRMVDAIQRGTFSLEEFTGAGANAAGTVVNTFNETVDPIDQAAIAMNNAKLAMAEVGEVVQVALLPFMEKATEVLGMLADKFRELSPETKNTILVIAGIAAAIGPVLVIVGTLVSSIGSIIAAFGTASLAIGVMTTGVASAVPGVGALAAVFTVLTGPIGIAIAAIAGVGAALVLAYNKVDWFRDVVDKAWVKIKELTSVAFEAIKKTISTVIKDAVDFAKDILDKFKVFWDENGKAIMAIVKLHFDLIKNNIQLVMGIIKGVFEVVWPVITSIIKVAWETIKLHVKNGIDLVLGIIQTVLKLLQGDWKGAWETIKKTAKTIWDNIEGYFKDVDLVQIGKDIIKGLIKGISSMVKAVGDAIKKVTSAITDTVMKILDLHSPSRVMMKLGEHTGNGLAIGVASTESMNKKAIEGVTKVISATTQKNADEVAKISTEAEKKRTEIQKDYAAKRKELGLQSAKSSQSALKTHKDKKGNIVTTGEKNVYKIRQDSSAKLTKLNEDEQKKLASINDKAWSDMQKKESEVSKAKLEAIKTYVSDKKSLDELSSVAESEVWRKSLTLFKEGTKERIEIQKAYQVVLEDINSQIISINTDFQSKIKTISDDLVKNEHEATKAYVDTVENRKNALSSFASTFEAYKVELNRTGIELIENLQSQVDGFKLWQDEFSKISSRGINGDLLNELSELGVKALPELTALNKLTDEQLTQYSALYQEKSQLAREQAEKELLGMKNDTKNKIDEMRIVANTELSKLHNEWNTKIKAVTQGTKAELSSLKQIGVDAGNGLLEGLSSTAGSLYAKAKEIADNIAKTIASALQVKSPSRVTMKLGEFVGEGLEVGMENSIASIRRAARTMATAAIPNVASMQGATNSGIGTSRNASGSSATTTENHYHMNITSPNPLNPYETARLAKNAFKEVTLQL